MRAWAQELERDLAWRESEVGVLKLLLAASPSGSARQRALMRACSAMLYAHYEGFCKFAWTLMLDTINAEMHPRRALIEPLAKRAMIDVFKTLRSNTSVDNLWNFSMMDFQSQLTKTATFPGEVDTKSNLWPTLAKEINASVGLRCPQFEVCEQEIGRLVDRRNKIAHGEKLEIADIKQFQAFENSVLLVMHDLAVAIVECLEKKTYLRTT